MADLNDVHQEAAATRDDLAPAFGETGFLETFASGQFDELLTTPAQRYDVVVLLQAMRHKVWHTRQMFKGLLDWTTKPSDEPVHGGWGLPSQDNVSATRLPFNRKERYFTGTVLPMIVADDGFRHLERLLSLCGLPPVVPPGLGGSQDLQFFTEYAFGESVFTDHDRRRFHDRPKLGDTPDIVLAGPDWLLAIEAKLYDQPTPDSLNQQLHRQSMLLHYWAKKFEIPWSRVRHVALLPEPLARRLGDVEVPVVTWEAVLDAYRVVGARYWLAQLAYALDHYDELAGPVLSFGANKQGTRRGTEIMMRGSALLPGRPRDQKGLDPNVPFDHMGRDGGLNGTLLTDDLTTGAWESRSYEVRVGEGPNDNWFAMEDFRARVEETLC